MAGGLGERTYRLRCVEVWSMVVPWAGFPLANLIEKLRPKPYAKYIRFQTFGDKKIGPNIGRQTGYPWPYTEGLTMAEARHPLTLIATVCKGNPFRSKTARPCVWSFHGSTASKAFNRSSKLNLSKNNQKPDGTSSRQTNMAFTPTSIPRWITRAGAKVPNVFWIQACSPSGNRL